MTDPETQQGLNDTKWYVESTRNFQKHKNCSFFVLDLVHDKFSKPALIAYANACRAEYPELAKDLDAKIAQLP